MSDKLVAKKPTINDVARLSGVSKRTVSRVINTLPNVKRDTRQKVLLAIRQLQYEPNPQARGLAFKRSYLIGLIYDNPNALYISDVQKGVLKACQGTGYELIMHPADFDSQRLVDDVRKFADRARLDGVILLSPISQLESVAYCLKDASCAYVRISPKEIDSADRVVVSNDRNGAVMMTEHLIELGHREIGFILGPPGNLSSQEKFNGFCMAMKRHKIPVRKRLVMEGANTFESGVIAAERVLKRATLPTAIFANNDAMALGVLKKSQILGVAVPQTLSIAGYDDSAYASLVWPDLTTVNQPVELMGHLAARKLIAQLVANGEQGDSPDVPVVPRLIIRHSTAALT